MNPGDAAIWTHTLPGGYGFTERIPVEVVRVTRMGRVTVRAPLKDGGTKLVSVKRQRLEAKEPTNAS